MVGADDLSLTLLDGFDVRVGSTSVTIRGARSCQVLTYLALHRGTTVSVDRLGEALWGEAPPPSARNSIQRFVSDLRRDLGAARERIESVGSGYRLSLGEDDWCDAVALEEAVPSAREALDDGRPVDAAALVLHVSAALVEPLASVGGAVFASRQRQRLSDLVADAGEINAAARLAQGDNVGAASAARALLAEHRYREGLCITLATALTRLGRANEALDAVTSFRARLRDDLGLEPSPAVEQTELDILLHRDTVPLLAAHPTPSPLDRSQSLLQAPTHPLIGRDAVVGHVAQLLEAKQVVTITGSGGIGKTSVAWAVLQAWQVKHEGATRERRGSYRSRRPQRKALPHRLAELLALQPMPVPIPSARWLIASALKSTCWCSTTVNTWLTKQAPSSMRLFGEIPVFEFWRLQDIRSARSMSRCCP